MNTVLTSEIAEPRFKTYIRGTALMLPALITWTLVREKCVPILVEIWRKSGQQPANHDGFWAVSMFLVQFGFGLLLIAFIALMLLESLSPGWKRHRRAGVTGLVWLVNLSVIIGLAALLTTSMILVPNLLK